MRAVVPCDRGPGCSVAISLVKTGSDEQRGTPTTQADDKLGFRDTRRPCLNGGNPSLLTQDGLRRTTSFSSGIRPSPVKAQQFPFSPARL